jgi:hypothetical protein
MKKVILLPSWQLFIIPLIIYIVTFTITKLSLGTVGIVLSTSINVVFSTLYCWFMWEVGFLLYEKAKFITDHTLKLSRFRISIIFPALFLVALNIINAMVIPPDLQQHPERIQEFAGMFLLLTPGYLLLIAAVLYSVRFVAKALTTLQIKRRARFNDYIRNFILYLFFWPIGVWVIHDDIKEAIDQDPNTIPGAEGTIFEKM